MLRLPITELKLESEVTYHTLVSLRVSLLVSQQEKTISSSEHSFSIYNEST